MIQITHSLYSRIIEHAKRESPRECCGILGGRLGAAEHAYVITNREPGTTRYLMDSEEQYRVIRDLEERGLELVGIYHSHPATQAYPSPTDTSLAFYPNAAYLICSLQNPEQPVVRAFRIEDGEIREIPIDIVGD
jgi:[CysO sulfur-carrier protein]-S-L-cysteine hydrolase